MTATNIDSQLARPSQKFESGKGLWNLEKDLKQRNGQRLIRRPMQCPAIRRKLSNSSKGHLNFQKILALR